MVTALVPYQSSSGLLTVVDLYDLSVIAGESFLPAGTRPAVQPIPLVVSGAFSVSGILSVVVVKNGVEKAMQLNSGAPLLAGCLYSFSHIVDEGEEINYEYSVDCIADMFKVQAVITQQAGIGTSNVYDVVTTAIMLTAMVAFGMMIIRNMKA